MHAHVSAQRRRPARLQGECWLKYQEAWDGSLDLDTTNLKVNARGMYSPAFRQEHKTAPGEAGCGGCT